MTPDDLPPPDPLGGLPLPAWLAGMDLGAPDLPDLPLLAGLSLPDPTGDEPPPAPPAPETAPIRLASKTPPPEPRPDPRPAPGWAVARQAVDALPDDGDESRAYRFEAGNVHPAEPRQVRVEFRLPRDARGVKANLAPKRTANGLEWDLGVLAPGEVRTLNVRVPLGPATGALRHAPAAVAVASRPVAAARLDVSASPPAVAPAGLPVAVSVVVANRGGVPSPEGAVKAFAGEALAARFALPAVAAGASHAVELLLPASPAGVARWRVVASAGDLPLAHASVEYRVAAAELAVHLDAPAAIETDDAADVRVVVENRGPVPAGAGTATLTVPDEFLYRGATAGGELAVTGDVVEWAVPELPAGGRWEATVRLEGFTPGRARLAARAGASAASVELACTVRRTAGGATLAELLGALGGPADDDLPELAAPTDAPRAAGERHLFFATADTRFAVPIGNVREVLRPLPITPVPGTPEWVAGVTNVRGDVVLTVDLAGFLGLEPTHSPRGLVIVRSDADPAVLGLLVGDVAGIRPLAHAPPDLPTDPRLARFLTGLGADAAGVVHRLSAADLLAAAEADAAAAVA